MAHRLAPEAEADLDEIWSYVAKEASVETADRLIESITARFVLLGRHPYAGRRRDDLRAGVRSFAVSEHVLLYRVDDSDVLIQGSFTENEIFGCCWASNMLMTNRVTANPKVMLGKPVIRGTRIPVEAILRKLSEGASHADLLDAYPGLTREDVDAALRYAAAAVAGDEVVFLNGDWDASCR